MRKSWGCTKPKGVMKVKARSRVEVRSLNLRRFGAQYRPVSSAPSGRRSKSVHVGTRKMVNYA